MAEWLVKQCSVLCVNTSTKGTPYVEALRKIGFIVYEACEWPDEEALLRVHVVLVYLPIDYAATVAARVRARPRFGRRVLVAVVPESTTVPQRRSAIESGFDEVVTECCAVRSLIARLLRLLRDRPEYRCVLPSGAGRSAA